MKLDWMEETVRVEPVSVWKYPVVVERVGAEIDEFAVMEDCDKIIFVKIAFEVTVDPSNVENEPEVREKDEMVSVELTVNVSTTIFALESVENRP
jgi:hypothetical protein